MEQTKEKKKILMSERSDATTTVAKNIDRRILTETFLISYDSKRWENALINDDPIFLEGCIQRSNAKNKNRRIYPYSVLKSAVDFYDLNFIKENRALGALDHPISDEESQEVHYKTASHRINKIWWKGDEVWGRIEILSGRYWPCANILRGCIKNNVPIGFSSRGMGAEIQLDSETFEVTDYDMICWDAVTNPSTHGAFGMITENSRFSQFASEEYQKIANVRNRLITSILS
jgi:hypothetical protein